MEKTGLFEPCFFILAKYICKEDRLMDIIDKQTDRELLQSLLAETAKAKNEVRCAQQDLQKATGRLNFVVMLTNKLIERQGD